MLCQMTRCVDIALYINLLNGEIYAPKQSHVVLYKGQKYLCASEEEHATSQLVPGSCISFFKNGISRGIAYNEVTGSRYYPAASMYTLPNQQSVRLSSTLALILIVTQLTLVTAQFPNPWIEVPYHGYDNRAENAVESIRGNDA